MSKHTRHSKNNNFFNKIIRNQKKLSETYKDIENVTKVIKFLKEQQPVPELKCRKELSQAYKEYSSKHLRLSEESEK